MNAFLTCFKPKRNHTRKNILFLFLLISSIVPFTAFGQTGDSNLGLSGYITSQSELENTVNVMESNCLIPYRVSFRPSWQVPEEEYKGYNSAYIEFLVSSTNFFIVVDGNHLYPPNNASAIDAQNHWNEVQQRIFQTLESYPNNSRVAVELINEYAAEEDFDSTIQGLIDEVRIAGYTNPLVINKLTTNWYKFSDPLNNTYQGMHFYFDTWNSTRAIGQIDIALSKGITKLLNTEVGASAREYEAFNQNNVDELEAFLLQSQTLGVSNCVWMNIDTENLEGYSQYDFLISKPTPAPTVTIPPTSNPTATPSPKPTPTNKPITTPNPTKLVKPEIKLLSPLNQTYEGTDIPLIFYSNQQVTSIDYSLDSQKNNTTKGNTTITDLSSGAHNLTLIAKYDAENIDDSMTIHFYVKEKQTESTSTITITAISIIAITFAAGTLTYIKKYKH